MTRTILVVEDIDLCRDALEVALMKVPDVRVRTVATAEEALRRLAEDDICALVTDLHLPHMDGFELIEAVRAHPRRSSLPILVISGDTDPRTPARLAGLGANAYFSKPYSPAEVRSRLEKLLNAS
jgi:two-component system, chemotaxis family, chemotaxis protein CheY